jgi:hypothetical protein
VNFDRTDAAIFGFAAAAHAALIAGLAYLASISRAVASPEGEAMEVSFVDEVGLDATAPTNEPAAQSFAPEVGAPAEAAPAPAEQPIPDPVPRPVPAPTPPQSRPAPLQAAPTPPAAQPARTPPRRPNRQAGAGTAPANRGTRLGPDFLKGLGADPASRSERPAGAVMNAQAQANIASAIMRQVQPCANRQRTPGPGAERIRVTIRLRLNRNGSLAAPPAVVRRTGVDDSNSRYAERVDDLAIATFTGCSPLRGLPAELYDVPRGWRDFRLIYNLPR